MASAQFPPSSSSPSDDTSLLAVLERFQESGYTGDLFAGRDGVVRCRGCSATSSAADLKVDHIRRLEGASDPADMQAVVAATCPGCRTKGVLVLHYGPGGSDEDLDVLAALPDLA
ncbi:MAG: hypothetical protein ABWZ76_11775 [Acidimicrobiales bacterium]